MMGRPLFGHTTSPAMGLVYIARRLVGAELFKREFGQRRWLIIRQYWRKVFE
jgi:hypothetical protein